ncbi:PAS domain-containing protein [Sediminicola luteus]|uniref:histidine kinase n=1 Tax=Sediminicola luteus TaxID=319238 RepID=A0ABV2TSM2_9FLAO
MMENQFLDITLLQSIFESTSEGILITDSQGMISRANKSAALILGERVGELVNRNLGEILEPRSKTKLLKLLNKDGGKNKTQHLQTKMGLLDVELKLAYKEKDIRVLLLRDVFLNTSKRKMLQLRNIALEEVDNGIIIADARLPDLPIIYCNNGFVKMTGYSKQEILNKNCRFLQADDNGQKQVEDIRLALEQGKPFHDVLRNYRKDGSLFWNELHITPVHDEANRLCYFIGMQNDVTIAMKEALIKERIRGIMEMIAKLHPLGEISKEIIGVLKEQLEGVNPVIGYLDQGQHVWIQVDDGSLSKQELEKMASLLFSENSKTKNKDKVLAQEVCVGDISKEKVDQGFRELALKHQILGYCCFPIISSENDVIGHLVLLNSDLGRPVGFEMELLEDMTNLASIASEHHKKTHDLQIGKKQLMEQAKKLEERVKERTKEVTNTVQKLVEVNLHLERQIKETKDAENKANQSQVMLAAIAQNFPKGAIIVFNSNYEIVYVEGEEMKHIDMIKEEAEGRSVDDIPFFNKHHISKIKEDIQETLKGKRLSFELGFEKKIYAVNSRPLYDANQGHVLALFVYNNITQQKRVEREIRFALKKEQELNDLKSRFVSMASHEFRTPLSAILSSAILIAKQNDLGNEDKIERYVERIKSNVRNLVVILNDFLSLDKLDEGKLQPNPQLFDLVQFSKTLIEEMKTNTKEGQTLKFTHNDEDILVYIDPKLLSHILINLMTNAIKYSEEKQEVILDVQNNGNQVVLTITDNGIGIPEKERQHLFERFFRAENALNIQGTGLGLHIVKQYVTLMEGTVNYKSELGKGTTFTVKLPKKLVKNENNLSYRG